MAKSKSKAVVVDAPEPDPTGLVEARQDGMVLGQWVAGLPAFFKDAQAIEASAQSFEAASALWQTPASKADDAVMVEAVRQARAKKHEAEEYWSITATVSKLHRRLTAKRAVAVDALDRVIARGTALHAQYEANERRRVEEEDRKRREAAEAEERERRAREQAELEAAALAAEAAAPDLSPRERVFVDYIANYGDDQAERAAKMAGYQDAGMGPRLLARPKIQAAVTAKHDARAAREQAAALAAAPVAPAYVAPTEAQLNSGTRYIHGAEIVNEAAFITACLDGQIPRMVALSVLTVNRPALNSQGRAFKALMNEWPGVRYKKTPGVV